MTEEEKNKRIHEILGLHWHKFPKPKHYTDIYGLKCVTNRGRRYSCGAAFSLRHRKPNLNFYTDAGAIQLLRELEKHEILYNFIDDIVFLGDEEKTSAMKLADYIQIPGLLADKLLEWRKVNDK